MKTPSSLGQLLPLITLLAATVTAASGRCGKRVPESLGCYLDNAGGKRALEARSYESDDMTVDSCGAFCQAAKFRLFAVTNGRECLCGGAVSEGNTKVADGDCVFPCAGNPTQTCGAENRVNLYKFVRAVTSSTSVSAPASSSSTSLAESSTSEPPVVTTSSSSVEPTTSSSDEPTSSSPSDEPTSLSSSDEPTTSTLDEPTTSTSDEPTTSSSDEPTSSSSSAELTSASDEPTTSSSTEAPTSSEESSTSTFPSSTSFSSESTSQGPSLTTVTSCPPTPTVADVPELCYYPKLPLACDRLTSAIQSRSMSTSLRACQTTMRLWGMTANPVATACFPTTTAAVPPNSAAAASTMSSVWSCLQSADLLCSVNADCVTKTYTVGQVPPPVPTVGVNILGDGGFESGTYGDWTLTGFNQYLTSEISTARPHSGTYGLHVHFPNTNGASGSLSRQLVDIEPGKPYEFRFWFYHENSEALMSLYQYVYPVGASTNFNDAQIVNTPTGIWRQRIVSFTPTSNFLNIRITPGGNVKNPNGSDQGKNNVWIDDIELVRMS